MPLLDPRIDAVFKLLFARPENERLLISLISAVLDPPTPIVSAKVLNPELPKELVDDRGVTLDVLAELADRTRVNIEMQRTPAGAAPGRWLYNLSRLFAGGIKRGDTFAALTRVVVITFLDLRDQGRFHERFRFLETESHRALSELLELHVIELPQTSDNDSTPLGRWARFLRASTDALDSLARGDPIMAEAKEALERLSQDPVALEIARKREEGEIFLRTVMQQAERAESEGLEKGLAQGLEKGLAQGLEKGLAQGLEKGLAQGLEKGLAQGRRAGLVTAIRGACELLGIEVDARRAAQLESASVDDLESLHRTLVSTRAWPT